MTNPSGITGAIDRILQVLRYVAELGSFSAKDIAEHVGIPPSTAYRLLQTLNSLNFVEKDAHGSFKIGREYYRIAALIVSRSDYETVSDPYLKDLSQQFGETCSLALYLPQQAAFNIVHFIPSSNPLQFVVQKFMPRSLMSGALGRAMLPFLPRDDVKAAYKNNDLQPDKGTHISLAELQASFEEIHRQGCFIGISPHAYGANSTAAPVFNSKGDLLGSIGIIIPNVRYDPARQEEISTAVKQAARQLSEALGYAETQRSHG